ncbi:beta-galactosidase [Novosphingobium sp. ST904]|nr:beta-galactosidase [Novosphingobium sp. ST904]
MMVSPKSCNGDAPVTRYAKGKRALFAALLGCCCSAFAPSVAQAASAQQPAAQGRSVLDLSQGWRFQVGDQPEEASRQGFDDAAWQTVSVPHTWNRLGEYVKERSSSANNYQGAGWYRLHVKAPRAAARERQFLDFAGVGKIADIWVNGTHVGRHEGAFARFRIDVTAVWKPGQDNLVVVRADNSKPTADNESGQVIPLSGDFFVNGGIYRGVTLLTAPDAGVDLLDFGGPGVYAKATSVTPESASVDVLVRLRNQGASPRKMVMTTTLRDAGGRTVATQSQTLSLAPGQDSRQVSLSLPRPHLWNGRADPYMYSIAVETREPGAARQTVTVPLGVRSFSFDANAGFFLNGKHVKLQGVSRHQDVMGKGWALSDEDHARDMRMIEELGANTVRQAHYQHADAWSDEADRSGMVVWAELPYVTTPSLSGGKGSDRLWANAEQQLREQIRQNYNHPSIMMWSVGNEVDSAKGFGVQGEPPQPLALLRHLNQIAKQEDPSRPTTFADCCEGLTMFKTAGEGLAGAADLIGYNRYYGWYMPNPTDARRQFGEALDKLHADHPTLPISVSEYGGGGSLTQHSDNVRAGFVNMAGRPQPEEFESFVHEENWPVIRERDYVFASWAWNMFDFPSDLRQEGDAIDLNTKGLVSFDRKTRKDAFYYYKAQWNPEPMIHLTGKRYVDRAYAVMEVRAYSNAAKARLTVNGQMIGETDCPDRICIWPDVRLAPGENRAVVDAEVGGAKVSDATVWTGPNPALSGIAIDAGDLAGRAVAGRRFGSDNFVTGGAPMILNMEGFGRKAANPRRVEAGSPELFEFWREGEAFSYAIPAPDGRWKVTVLTFQPSPAAPGSAMMAISANGALAVPAFNIAASAGGALKAKSITFAVDVRGGVLKLDFAGKGGKAVVAAITLDK